MPFHELHEIFEFRCKKNLFFSFLTQEEKKQQKEQTIDWNTYIAYVNDIREFIHASNRLFFWTGIHTQRCFFFVITYNLQFITYPPHILSVLVTYSFFCSSIPLRSSDKMNGMKKRLYSYVSYLKCWHYSVATQQLELPLALTNSNCLSRKSFR